MPSGGATAAVAPDDFASLSERYEARGEAVGPFLRDNPSLVPVLHEIAERAPAFFGPDVELAVAMVRDPEDGGAEEPFVFVRTGLPPDNALARLHGFDEAWWLRASASVEPPLTVTLEYA